MIINILLVIGTVLCIMGLFLSLGFGDNFICFEIGLVMLCLSVGTFIGICTSAIYSYYNGGGL